MFYNKEWSEKELEEAHKFCETITVYEPEKFDIEIAKRIKEGRKIKDIKVTRFNAGFTATILYDYEG